MFRFYFFGEKMIGPLCPHPTSLSPLSPPASQQKLYHQSYFVRRNDSHICYQSFCTLRLSGSDFFFFCSAKVVSPLYRIRIGRPHRAFDHLKLSFFPVGTEDAGTFSVCIVRTSRDVSRILTFLQVLEIMGPRFRESFFFFAIWSTNALHPR